MDLNKQSNIIPPVTEGIKRPKWSVMIPTYNPKEQFLIQAVNSVIIQDLGSDKMQIEVVDDCSTKVDVEKIVNDNWKGRVNYHRLPENVGHSFNFTECVRRSKGELVHLLHDDDKVKPGFYKIFESIFAKYENTGAVFCRQEYIDDDDKFMFHSELEMDDAGILDDALIKLAEKQRIQYCAMVVKREVYEKIGGYITKNIGCEDWEMWVRIAANFEICYEPEALAQYRIHRTSMTLTDMRTGQDMRFLREAAEIFTEYLPPEKRDKVTLFRNKHYAVYSLNNAKRMYEEFKDEEGAAAQLSETILLDSGLVYKHLDFLRNFKKEIDGAGVSVVICTENDEETIESTLRSLKKQIVPDYIPWEIVIIDNGSNDNTIKLAEESLKILKGKVTYKIFEKSNLNLFDFRKEAIDNSKFNYIIFCNPGDFLNKDYVRKASENMMKEHDTGILGGYSEYESQIIPPDWFNKNTFKYYHIGEQYDVPGEITWSRGYVWGSGMVLRREAWKSLIKKYFKPVFPEGPGKTYNSLFDKKLCFAIRTNKWRIRYSVDLTLNRFINREEFSWKYLRKLQRQNGVNSVILSRYPEFESKKEVDFKNLPGIKNRRKYVKEAIRKLKSYDFRKLCSFENIHENDPEIPDIEFQMGKLSELLKELNSYNKKIRILKRYSRKRDFQFLKFCFPDPYFRFPQYHKLNDRRGLTILFDFENTSYDLLFRSLDKIAAQQLPEKFPWEVIISYKKIDPEIIEKIKIFWKRVKCTADLTFCKAIEINPGNNPALSENSIRRSKFDHLLLLNEKNFINIDFVRIAYKVIRANKRSGVVFGKTEYGSDVKPPKWFGNFKSYYGIGNEPGYSGIVKRDNAFFNRTGFVINKKILTEIDLNKIQELSDLKSIISEKVFEIIYEPRLIVNKYIPVKELSWEYARGLNKKIGAGFTGTDIQIRNFPKTEKLSEAENITVTQSWIYKANKTFGKIRKHPIKKIFSEKNEFVNDTEILEIERLKGEFRKIISSKGRNGISTDTFELSSNGNGSAVSKKKLSGVSIVICCYNSAKVLPLTLEYLIKQKNTENIPWEIIVVNNASTDGTALIAEKLWLRSNSLTPLRIVKENQPGLSAARQLGINTAEYEYVVFCDDDNRLEENFVRNAFEIMNSDESIGVLGGFGDSEYETLPKPWFKDWMDSFAIGKQSENAGDITWSRGFVWGAAMVIRKEAWNKLKAGGFRSILTDRVGNTLSAGGDTEICYALRNNGWKIWYDPSLKFTHYITEERLNWNYLRNLFRGFGNASSGLDVYLKKIPGKVRKEKRIVIPKSVRQELHKALKTLRKTRYKKLLSFKRRREGDTDIPLIEYTIGRIYSLINTRGSYNSGLKLLKKVVRKKDLKYISSDFRNKNPDFPKYRTQKKLNGVSVIVCTYNGADRLAETIRHIANQKVDKNILWEVILVDNASTDNSKEVTKAEWDKHKCSAKLIIVDQPVPGKQLALEKGYEVAKYEYWITCDDDNWLDENFVQLTYNIMSSDEKIGALGGPNEALCELDPPEWFQWFQKDYAAGPQGDIYTGKVSDGDITWKRGFVWGAGMIVRKSAWEKLLADGFRTSMSCRKGTELSSGGDSEACYALVLAGWHIWYDRRLKLKHCMPAGRLDWNYLVRLFSGFGVATVGLELYEKAIKLGRADIDEKEILKQNWKYEFGKAIGELRKYGIKKILSLRHPKDNDTQIPMLEFYLSKVKELWKDRKEYDKKFEEIINAPWRKSFSFMKSEHRKFLESENDFRYGWPWSEESVSSIETQENAETKHPKISILSPSFNSAGTIEKAILSVLRQGYPNFEHIICDAGSTDGTVDILKKYPHLKWISEPDKGQSDAMNKAFDMSDGDLISYLNVDDYYQRRAFKKIAKAFKENPESEMVVGNLFFEYGDHTYTRNAEIDYKKIMLPFRYMFPINPVSYFYKRSMQTDIGPFPLDNHMTMDYWFLLKAYQKHKLYKIEDYLGTFCMNGYNKTSGADNRKNTRDRVIYHCWHYDKKNLPYYLYNYLKFFYYDQKPYNLKKIGYKLKKNTDRVISVLTFKKNKYYNQKLYVNARNSFYEKKRFKAFSTLMVSYMIYPKSIKQSTRSVLLSYSLFGIEKTERLKWFYFFLTTPPGLPLANKLHYYGNEYRNKNKSIKGNTLLFLTYLISPKFLFKSEKQKKEETAAPGFKFRYLNPFYWLKRFIDYFRFKKYREKSYEYYMKAGDRYYFHKYNWATFYMIASFLVYPLSVTKKSRLNLFLYTAFGSKDTEKLNFIYHLYKDNPEYTFAHKIDYYGNELRKKGETFKGNSILIFAYILSPKYIFRRKKIKKSNIVYASEFRMPGETVSYNPLTLIKRNFKNIRNSGNKFGGFRARFKHYPEILKYKFVSVYHYFRYRKFKARSKELYSLARESYSGNKRLDTLKLLIPSILLYPPSVFNRNKLSLMINSIIGNSAGGKLKGKN